MMKSCASNIFCSFELVISSRFRAGCMKYTPALIKPVGKRRTTQRQRLVSALFNRANNNRFFQLSTTEAHLISQLRCLDLSQLILARETRERSGAPNGLRSFDQVCGAQQPRVKVNWRSVAHWRASASLSRIGSAGCGRAPFFLLQNAFQFD